MKKLLLLAIALFSSAILFTSCGSSSPSDTVKSALSCAMDSDWEGYADYMNVPDAEKEQAIQMLTMKGDEAFPYSDFTIVSEEIAEDGNSAVVKVEYTKKKGGTKNDTEKLELVDGKWLIKG